MELRELSCFVTVVEAGSVSAAARLLHLSQPALSQTVRSLEREFSVPLLVRSSTGVMPTEAGRTLLVEARAVLSRAEALRAALDSHGSGGRPVLRLGVPLELPAGLLSNSLESSRTRGRRCSSGCSTRAPPRSWRCSPPTSSTPRWCAPSRSAITSTAR